jgi:hypothetical protein
VKLPSSDGDKQNRSRHLPPLQCLFYTAPRHGFTKPSLHNQGQALQLVLQDGQGATSHLHPAGGVTGSLGRYAEAAPRQENLHQLGSFARIDQTSLQKVIP